MRGLDVSSGRSRQVGAAGVDQPAAGPSVHTSAVLGPGRLDDEGERDVAEDERDCHHNAGADPVSAVHRSVAARGGVAVSIAAPIVLRPSLAIPRF
jgi:hypothetical protein